MEQALFMIGGHLAADDDDPAVKWGQDLVLLGKRKYSVQYCLLTLKVVHSPRYIPNSQGCMCSSMGTYGSVHRSSTQKGTRPGARMGIRLNEV